MLDNHVKNKKHGNFIATSSLINAQHKNLKTFAVPVYGHVYIIMVILRSQNTITDFFRTLAQVWALKGLMLKEILQSYNQFDNKQ